jgi:hypothetical protein
MIDLRFWNLQFDDFLETRLKTEVLKKYFCHFERSREVFFGFRKQDIRIKDCFTIMEFTI